jgi:hypothetical protein
MSSAAKIMITRREGEDWDIIPIHSIVIQGMRWDALNERWAAYPYTVEEIEENQRNDR